MSIIAPVFPAINSAFSVGKFTQKIIVEELYRGKNLLYQILKGNLPWDALFDENADFFSRYDSYLRLDVSAGTEVTFRTWYGCFHLLSSSIFTQIQDGVSQIQSEMYDAPPGTELQHPLRPPIAYLSSHSMYTLNRAHTHALHPPSRCT